MIKQEKINKKLALKRVKDNLSILLKSNKSMKDIFEITFKRENFTIFNLIQYNSLIEITYKEAKSNCVIFAKYFSNNINSSNKYVGILMNNCPEFIYSLYGLLMSGFIPVLLNNKATFKENKEVLDELGATTIVSDINITNFSHAININDIKENNYDLIENWANEIVFTTSGTSGKPKIIMYTGEELTEQIINSSYIIKNYPIIGSSYKGYLKHLLILPLYHVFGFIAVFLWFSFFNTTFIIPSSLSPDHIREACLIGKPSHIFAVPLFWDSLVKKILQAVKENDAEKKFNKGIGASIKIQKHFPKSGSEFVKNKLFKDYLDRILGKSIKICISGGAYISKETLRIINGLGYPLINGFGSTEIGISSFASPKKITSRINNSIGAPFISYQYKINDKNELLVNGKSLYHSMLINKNWVNRDRNSYLSTMDNSSFINGEYFINGRMDDIYVDENGENYSLCNIEQYFKTSFAIDAVVVPNKLTNSLAIVLSFNENASDFQINYDVVNIFKSNEFNTYHIKDIYVIKHELEKANGLKIKRNLIINELTINSDYVRIDLNSLKDVKSFSEVNEKVLKIVMKIFEDVTGNKHIDKDSDFFLDLGGSSLSYYEILQKIEGNFGIKINLEDGIIKTPYQFAIFIQEKIK